jgi:hypothetical protein
MGYFPPEKMFFPHPFSICPHKTPGGSPLLTLRGEVVMGDPSDTHIYILYIPHNATYIFFTKTTKYIKIR